MGYLDKKEQMEKTYTFTEQELRENCQVAVGIAMMNMMIVSAQRKEDRKEDFVLDIANDIFQIFIK